jgi:hypothetical protein
MMPSTSEAIPNAFWGFCGGTPKPPPAGSKGGVPPGGPGG